MNMMRRFKKTVSPGDFLRNSLGNYAFGKFKHVPGIEGHRQTREDFGDKEIAGWFLGTKGENSDVFSQLIAAAVQDIAYGRRSFHPEDPGYITEEVKNSTGYLQAIQSLKDNLHRMVTFLNDYSVPFWSMRYQGHMNWDVTLPSLLGYFTAMLQNQNNVSIQGSPATTILELFAGNDICSMLGYDTAAEVPPWGHITCDGSVANLEALWSARELRFLPVGIKVALDKEYPRIKNEIYVQFGGQKVKLAALDAWELLNLANDEILSIPNSIAAALKDSEPDKYRGKTIPEIEADVWNCLVTQYSINALGIVRYYRDDRFLGGKGIGMPAVIVPSSKHYSWPKAASILGMGHGLKNPANDPGIFLENGLINVWVNELARMHIDEKKTRKDDIDDLSAVLDRCQKNKKPLLLTVAVIGSTEESAVDPLNEILRLRDNYRAGKYGTPFDFNIHADAAWGGYLISIIREDFDIQKPYEKTAEKQEDERFIKDTSKVPLSDYVITQLKHLGCCDSITVDPHKWGYVPYPAGSLCYRNGRMINLVTFGAPYIQSDAESQALSMGESGIEGSKPGAAAAAVFLSHCVIRPSIKGYGKLMTQAVFNSRLYYAYMVCMSGEKDDFLVVPFNEPPKGPDGQPGPRYIKENIYDKSCDEIRDDPKVMAYLKQMGPDQNFVDYVINFYLDTRNGKVLNTDPEMVLKLQDKLFENVYIKPQSKTYDYEVMISKTTFYREDYGPIFMNALARRLQLENPEKVESIPCMRSVVMDPWIIETKMGQDRVNFFKEVFIPELYRAIADSVKETKQEAKQLIAEVTGVKYELRRENNKMVLVVTADGNTGPGRWCEPELVWIEESGPGRITFEFRVYPLEIGNEPGAAKAEYLVEDWQDTREIMVIARQNHIIAKVEPVTRVGKE